MSLILQNDNFARSNTSTGSAGSTTGVGNGWTDSKGGVWSIQGDNLVGVDPTGNFRNSFLYRPSGEGCRDQQISVTWQSPSSNASTGTWGPIVRAMANVFYLAFFNSDTGVGSGTGSVSLYAVNNNTSTVTAVGSTVNLTTAYVPGHVYVLTLSATGVSPTTLSFTMSDSTAGGTVCSLTGTDSSAGLQTTTAVPGITLNGTASETILGAQTVNLQSTAVAVTDGNLFFTGNWLKNGSTYVQSANAGAYLKTGFTGTAVNVNVDTSPLSTGGVAAGNYPLLAWSVDDGTWVSAQLTPGQTAVPCGAGLASGTHTLTLMTIALGSDDQWTTPADVVRVTGLTVDTGMATSAPTLAPMRLFYWGDSISVGTRVLGIGFNFIDHDARYSPAFSQGSSLRAETSLFGYGGQGWNVAGSSNIPAFSTAWSSHDANHSMLVGGVFPNPPDYAIVDLGENDYLFSVSPTTVQTTVTSTLASIRAAIGSAPLLVRIPRSGGQRSAITAGVVALNDPNTHLVDLGTTVQTGLTAGALQAIGSLQSVDQVHPYGFTNLAIEPLAAVAIKSALSSSSGSGAAAITVATGIGF